MKESKKTFAQSVGEIGSAILFESVSYEGKEYIPQNGPAIVAFNHMGWSEILPLLKVLPANTTALVKKESNQLTLIGMLPKKFGWIGIDRQTGDTKALNTAIEALCQNKILLLSPEGTRGRERDGNRKELKEAHMGVVFIGENAAKKLEKPIPVIPVAIFGGSESVFPEIDDGSIPLFERLSYRREKVFVRFGEPIALIHQEDRSEIKKYRLDMTEKIMLAIRDMLPSSYHGIYKHY